MLSMVGYSQGSQVVRLALAQMDAGSATVKAVSSVILFGDPKNGTSLTGGGAAIDPKRVMEVCRQGDEICAGKDFITSQHLSYSDNATAAAMFVMQRSRLGIVSQDAMNNGMGNVPTLANPNASG
jgi:hypothetical protein